MSYTNLLVEEAYYWNYAQHLDFGYIDHPPMVALLIKLSTFLLGNQEFGVRLSALFCWILTTYYSFKLTDFICRGAGPYAVLLLSILPFFFLQSLVITPDLPLMVCWSATLFYLYRALILEEPHAWYLVGVWMGLGMLSKYTIALLGPATLLYLLLMPSARRWFVRKEPYACALIAALLFTPVIYWNATHDWASFVFQSKRRFADVSSFSLHELIGLLLLFITPCGVFGLLKLFNSRPLGAALINFKTRRFLQIFTLLPLVFFGYFSLKHAIKFNWIGPGLLALIPWLAYLLQKEASSLQRQWLITGIFLFIAYSGMIWVIAFGSPEWVYKKLFTKYIAWDNLTQQVHGLATNVEAETHTTPFIVPLDTYGISSELLFYQAKLLRDGEILKSFPIMGQSIFDRDCLMYQYWSSNANLSGKTLIILSNSLENFKNPTLKNRVIEKSAIQTMWTHSPVRGTLINPVYYQVVQMRH